MIAGARIAFGSFLVAAALVFGVTSAEAGVNIVPNPGFEIACGSVPCNWTGLFNPGGTTIARDTVNPHSGSASIAISSQGNFAPFSAGSDCISISPNTQYSEQGWYRTTSATASQIMVIQLNEYSSASCTSTVALDFIDVPPVTTGVWTLISGPITTNANAHSASFTVGANCNAVCPAGQQVNFDDVAVFTGTTLAVTVSSFAAHRAGKGVLLRWRTGTEANELGFNVYRQQGGRRVRVNRRLLPALGAVAGSSYSYRDGHAPRHRAVRYWLQDVSTSGARTWHGPVRVGAA